MRGALPSYLDCHIHSNELAESMSPPPSDRLRLIPFYVASFEEYVYWKKVDYLSVKMAKAYNERAKVNLGRESPVLDHERKGKQELRDELSTGRVEEGETEKGRWRLEAVGRGGKTVEG